MAKHIWQTTVNCRRISHVIALSLLVIFLTPFAAYAMEITSPFGWRLHPVTGEYKYHSGVDIAGEFGDAIPAVMDGIATTGYDPGGYGNYVEISHPDGTVTLYGHCQDVYVRDGESVKAGQIIAAVGSTGRSTGPHVHVEYILNGRETDPVPLLIAHGWDLTWGGGSDMHFDEDSAPWNFGEFNKIADQLRIVLNKVSKQCTEGLKYLQEEALTLLYVLMVIDFAFVLILYILNDDPLDWSELFVKKTLQYGFITMFITNWGDYINLCMSLFVQKSVLAAGGGVNIAENLSDPSLIIQKGVHIVQPVFDYLSKYSGTSLTGNIHHVLIALFFGVLILGCFIIIGLQFFIAYLQFYIVSTMSVVLLPFGVSKQLRFLGELGLGSIINAALKLMVMTFVVAMAIFMAQNLTPGEYKVDVYFNVLVISLALLYLINKVSDMATLIYGSLKL